MKGLISKKGKKSLLILFVFLILLSPLGLALGVVKDSSENAGPVGGTASSTSSANQAASTSSDNEKSSLGKSLSFYQPKLTESSKNQEESSDQSPVESEFGNSTFNNFSGFPASKPASSSSAFNSEPLNVGRSLSIGDEDNS